MITFFIVVVVAFAASYILSALLFGIFDWEMTTASGWTVMIILTVLITTILYLIKGKVDGCPKCRKNFAMKEISRKTIGRRETMVDIDREVKNARGEVVRRYKEAVPATQYTYNCVDECKFCGYRREVKRYETIRKLDYPSSILHK